MGLLNDTISDRPAEDVANAKTEVGPIKNAPQAPRRAEYMKNGLSTLIPDREFIAQNMAARHPVDRRLAAPTLANHFPGYGSLTGMDSIGQVCAQVKIALHALLVRTVKREHGSSVSEIDSVLELARAGEVLRGEIRQLHSQRLQLLEPFGEGRRVLDSLAFLPTVFRPRPESLMVHKGMSDRQ
jgi:hypothetical protein